VRALIDYGDFLRRRGPAPARRTTPLKPSLGADSLTEREAKAILDQYGISVTREKLATSLADAEAAAEAIGWPVAIKVESPQLLHKTEAGAVMLNIPSKGALQRCYELVLSNVRAAQPAAEIRGVLVQEQVIGGTEMIVGMKRDPHFGPVIAVGLGGIFVEVFEDVQFLLPPVSEDEARAALLRLRGYKVLQGARGRPPADIDALVDTIIRFSDLCQDVKDSVDEIDINPLIVLPSGVRAVDALIVPRRAVSASGR